MTRVVTTLVGVGLLALAAFLAVAAIRPAADGTVSLSWSVAAIILLCVGMGGFFVSRSLMTDFIRTVASAARRARKSGAPTP